LTFGQSFPELAGLSRAQCRAGVSGAGNGAHMTDAYDEFPQHHATRKGAS
jgi:hypothetical protein